jgi:hypothetical protein
VRGQSKGRETKQRERRGSSGQRRRWLRQSLLGLVSSSCFGKKAAIFLHGARPKCVAQRFALQRGQGGVRGRRRVAQAVLATVVVRVVTRRGRAVVGGVQVRKRESSVGRLRDGGRVQLSTVAERDVLGIAAGHRALPHCPCGIPHGPTHNSNTAQYPPTRNFPTVGVSCHVIVCRAGLPPPGYTNGTRMRGMT